jgi:hypothetical protein
MRRLLGITAAGALAASGLALSGPAQAIAPRSIALAAAPTDYSLTATGYGTKVSGGNLSVNSGRTAYSHIGCTRSAGLNRANHVAGVRLERLADAEAVRSRSWTTSGGGVVAANSSSSIARVTVGNVRINTIKASTRSWHDSAGFHARATTSVAGVVAAGVDLGVPTAGNPIVVPGVVRVALGGKQQRDDAVSASAKAISLRITVLATDTKIIAGYASSRIDGNVTGGIFSGHANGSQVRILGRTATSGKTSLQPIPCAGTRGEVRSNTTASVNALGATVRGLESSVYGVQQGSVARGYTRAKVVKATLFQRIRVSGVVARANVTLQADGTHVRTANGTKVGGVFLDGQRLRIGADNLVKIANLALVRVKVVDKSRNGIDVVAVRIKLLAGPNAGSVIDLAHAKLSIGRS